MPVVVAHAAVLALVMAGSGAEIARAGATRSLAVFDVAPPAARQPVGPSPAPSSARAETPRSLVAEPVQMEIAAPDPVPMPLLSQASLAPGETCDLAGRVQAALRDDPAVRAALAMLPRDARSVANAVMLWDGRWIAGTTTSTSYALDRIRAAVIATVAAAPAPCRQEAQTGPVLMLLAGSPDTVLALGSGRWRWGDVFGAGGGMPLTIAGSVDEAPSPAT